MDFVRYQHVERIGTPEVENIELGVCFVFAKLDGSNAGLWSRDGQLYGGSRNRLLSLENDNAGFLAWALDNRAKFDAFFAQYPNARLYGEWMVPHTLRTYREDSWKRFWVFDVFNDDTNTYTPYEIYAERLEAAGIDYIPPLVKITNPSVEQLHKVAESNTFLIQDGSGVGEGIVVKNYDFQNRYGRTVWAKLVRNEFKESNRKLFGVAELKGEKTIEPEIAEKYVSKAFVDKTRAKIELDIQEKDGKIERARLIPRLLQTCFHELVKEESYNFVKEYKNPTIDFKKLQAHVIYWVKKHASDLF